MYFFFWLLASLDDNVVTCACYLKVVPTVRKHVACEHGESVA